MTTKTATKSVKAEKSYTSAQVREAWPTDRAEQIVTMMKGGLPYWRAVRRSRRYFLEGKY